MRVHDGIRDWLKCILTLSKDSLNIRYSRAVLEEIKELINQGKYGSYADFMNRAAVELLHREKTDERIRALVAEEVRRQLGR